MWETSSGRKETGDSDGEDNYRKDVPGKSWINIENR